MGAAIKAETIVGNNFGKLYVKSYVGKIENFHRYLCRCDCGQEKVMIRGNVLRGLSCGCATRPRILKYGGEHSQVTKAFDTFVRSAKKRDISNELDRAQWFSLTQQPCYYCGTEKSNCQRPEKDHTNSFRQNFYYNGIDRKDSSLGYVVSNCVPCCKHCNMAKRELTDVEFINHARRIVNYQDRLNG